MSKPDRPLQALVLGSPGDHQNLIGNKTWLAPSRWAASSTARKTMGVWMLHSWFKLAGLLTIYRHMPEQEGPGKRG